MTKLQEYIKCGLRVVKGVFRIRTPRHRIARNGNPFTEMQIEDMSCKLPAYLWVPNNVTCHSLGDYHCVEVSGQIRWRRDGPVLDLSQVQPSETDPDDAVRLIPESICPIPWLLSCLEACISHLTHPALRKFALNVLANDSIAFPYVSAPASLKHHHNYPGGLLAHSIECYQLVKKHHEFSRNDFELGLVAVLFHDVGKILTITHDMRRTSLGYDLDHDKLTLEVLSPYLRQLDIDWPDGARRLRYLLTWKKGQKIPKYDMADLVSCCDRISAGRLIQSRCSSNGEVERMKITGAFFTCTGNYFQTFRK